MLRERPAVTQHHALHARSRDRVHAQLEVVALGCFEQAGVDAAAGDLLEHRLAARLVHRHRIAQLAVDVHRKAGDALSLGQRELKLAFENAAVRIAERELHFGEREAAVNLRAYAHRFERHGRLDPPGNHQLRARDADRCFLRRLGERRRDTERGGEEVQRGDDEPADGGKHGLLLVGGHAH